jgi:trehalose-6-phosphate synthase
MASRSRDPVIFVVSNRLPVTVSRSKEGVYELGPSSGGLVNALQEVAGSRKFRWYGWPGMDIPETDRTIVKEKLAERGAYPVFLEKEQAEKHYNGFSSAYLHRTFL